MQQRYSAAALLHEGGVVALLALARALVVPDLFRSRAHYRNCKSCESEWSMEPADCTSRSARVCTTRKKKIPESKIRRRTHAVSATDPPHAVNIIGRLIRQRVICKPVQHLQVHVHEYTHEKIRTRTNTKAGRKQAQRESYLLQKEVL